MSASRPLPLATAILVALAVSPADADAQAGEAPPASPAAEGETTPYDVDYRSTSDSTAAAGGWGQPAAPPPVVPAPPPSTGGPLTTPAPVIGRSGTSTGGGQATPSGGRRGGAVWGSVGLAILPDGRVSYKDYDYGRQHGDFDPALGASFFFGGGGARFSIGGQFMMSRVIGPAGKLRYIEPGILLRPRFPFERGSAFFGLGFGLSAELWQNDSSSYTATNGEFGIHTELSAGVTLGRGYVRPFLSVGLLFRKFPKYSYDSAYDAISLNMFQALLQVGVAFGG